VVHFTSPHDPVPHPPKFDVQRVPAVHEFLVIVIIKNNHFKKKKTIYKHNTYQNHKINPPGHLHYQNYKINPLLYAVRNLIFGILLLQVNMRKIIREVLKVLVFR
jgi:hypothetical protein